MKIDIIVPTYNRVKDLEKFIFEIQRQDNDCFHVYIIDDHGDNDLSRLIPKSNKFSLIRLENNKGQAFARNFAVSRSEGDIIVFMDDDAYFTDSNAINKINNHFQNKDISGLMFNIKEPNREWLDKRKFLIHMQEITGFIACGCAFRRSAFTKTKGFPEHFHSYGEETYISMSLIQNNEKIIFVKDVKLYHNYNPGDRDIKWIKRFKRNSVRNDLLIVRKKFPVFLVPIYFSGKFLSHLRHILFNSSHKTVNIKAAFLGCYNSIFEKTDIKRDPLSFPQFKHWKKNRI